MLHCVWDSGVAGVAEGEYREWERAACLRPGSPHGPSERPWAGGRKKASGERDGRLEGAGWQRRARGRRRGGLSGQGSGSGGACDRPEKGCPRDDLVSSKGYQKLWLNTDTIRTNMRGGAARFIN